MDFGKRIHLRKRLSANGVDSTCTYYRRAHLEFRLGSSILRHFFPCFFARAGEDEAVALAFEDVFDVSAWTFLI